MTIKFIKDVVFKDQNEDSAKIKKRKDSYSKSSEE